MTSTVRRPPATAAPVDTATVKTPCAIDQTSVIAEKARFTGSHLVRVGKNSVIHPHATLKSDHGKVLIGNDCSISERAIVGIVSDSNGVEQDVVIGDGVNIHTGARVEAQSIGTGSTIDIHARVEPGAVIGEYCKVGPMEVVGSGEVLEDFTVVYGNGQRRIDRTTRDHRDVLEAKIAGQTQLLKVYRKLIPNFSAKYMG